MTLANEQDFCVLMSFFPLLKRIKIILSKVWLPVHLATESHYIHMKYTGGQRLLLTPPAASEMHAYSVC